VISGARTEAPGLHSQCNPSIIEVGFESENLEHPGANEVELHPAGKSSLQNFHSFEEEAMFAALQGMFVQ
jgi:hypothetical protein